MRPRIEGGQGKCHRLPSISPKTTLGSLDELNGLIYSAGSTDIDPSGDDAGKIPSDIIVGITCIPPSFNVLVDSAGDLPGPATAAVPITVQLLP